MKISKRVRICLLLTALLIKATNLGFNLTEGYDQIIIHQLEEMKA